jgi:hypothetical protein
MIPNGTMKVTQSVLRRPLALFAGDAINRFGYKRKYSEGTNEEYLE